MTPNFEPIKVSQAGLQNNFISRRRSPFNDSRLATVFKDYEKLLLKSGRVSVRRSTKSQGESTKIYRFLKNKRVEIPEVIKESCKIASSNVEGKHILVVGDTTSFNYEKRKNRIKDIRDMGILLGSDSKGFYSHVSLAVCAEQGSILGLSDILLWNQSKEKREKDTRYVPIGNKITNKWLLGGSNSKKVLSTASKLTHVYDREADNYETLYHVAEVLKDDLVIRQSQARKIKWEGKRVKVEECLSVVPLLGEIKIDVPYVKTKKRRVTKIRKARMAKLEIKVAEGVEVSSTELVQCRGTVKLNLIEIKENTNGKGKIEDPIQWRLWTTHEVFTMEQVLRIIKFYKWRWLIEELFRTVKSKGFDQESTELETVMAIMKQTVMTLKAGSQVLQLVYAREKKEVQPIDQVFKEDEIKILSKLNDQLEGKTEKQKNKNPKSKLSWAAWIIGRLGGWKGYSKERPPGPITMKRGLEKFNSYLEVLHLLNTS